MSRLIEALLLTAAYAKHDRDGFTEPNGFWDAVHGDFTKLSGMLAVAMRGTE